MKNPDISPWTTHRTRIVYDNPWLSVSESDVTNPGGGEGIYGVVHYKTRAIGVVPIDDEDNTWLVGQYRYAMSTFEWEIPEGGCPPDEEPVDAALRELKEETGLIAAKCDVLLDNLALSNSVTDERCTIFIATELTPGDASPEESEELSIRKLPLSKAIEMVHKGAITDSVSVMALLKLDADRK